MNTINGLAGLNLGPKAYHNEYQKKYYHEIIKPDPVKYANYLAKSMASQLWRHYRLTWADYDRLLLESAGECAICDEQCQKLHIDHDHTTGKVRGLLCVTCNNALAIFERDEWMKKAKQYLEERS